MATRFCGALRFFLEAKIDGTFDSLARSNWLLNVWGSDANVGRCEAMELQFRA
jgi:hypothetical protein